MCVLTWWVAVYITGDAFSEMQGWVEGALKTSVVAYSKIKPKLDALTGLRASGVSSPGVRAEPSAVPRAEGSVPLGPRQQFNGYSLPAAPKQQL